MLRVRDGDLDKLGLLFERYKKRLFGFFYNMTHDREQSEDLVQNTFMRIMKYRKSFRAESPFRVWMFQVARNIAYDHFKKNPDRAEDIEFWSGRIGDETPTQEEYITKNEEVMLLKKAILRLPAEKREILTLSKVEGVKYKEIGGILGCTEGTVKAKVFRALRALKKEYEYLQSNV